MSDAPSEITRIHEAGHAVACVSLRVPIKWVDCWEEDGALRGQVAHEAAPADADAVIAFAGMVAEALKFGESIPEATDGDIAKLAHLSHDEQRKACDLACLILKQNWPAVETLAEVLKDRPTLRGEEIINHGE